MSLFIVGADGLRLMNFHLESCGMRVVLKFIVFIIWFWKVLVEFVVDFRKLFLSKFEFLCCIVGWVV